VKTYPGGIRHDYKAYPGAGGRTVLRWRQVGMFAAGVLLPIAGVMLLLIGKPSPIVLLAVVGLMTSFFTLVISNVGATVLLVPLCMNMAVMAGGDPRMAALVVGLSASNTFVLPTHQVNALVMRPGGYRTVDYAKAGLVMTAIFLTVELTILYFFYGIQ